MQLGDFTAKIRPDLYGSDRIEVCVSSGVNSTYVLYDPVTLEEDFGAEDQRRRQEKKEEFDDWVGSYGPEECKKMVDENWNRNRG